MEMATVRVRVWARAISTRLGGHEVQMTNPRLIQNDISPQIFQAVHQPCSPSQRNITSATPTWSPTGTWPPARCTFAPESLLPHCARPLLGAAGASSSTPLQLPSRGAALPGRGFSSSANEGGDEEMPVVYQGPFAAPLRSVKLLSVSTCALSVTMGPILTFLALPGVDVLAKGAVGSLFMLASASTTGALHWLSSPYIHRMRWRKGSPYIDVETLTWLATHKKERLRLADVRFPYTNRPLASFSVHGRHYYLETSLLEDEDLLTRLQP